MNDSSSSGSAAGLSPLLEQRLQAVLGPVEFGRWRRLAWADEPVGLRINTLKVSVPAATQALGEAGFTPRPLDGIPAGLLIPAAERSALTHSALVDAGWVYPQNPASMLPAVYLDTVPGDEVLDLAAAPGSKTLQLAALMRDQGRLAAVEPGKRRFFKLRANVERAGASCVRLYRKDGRAVGRLTPERFDRVLLDAPCSSEGRIRADKPDSAAHWSIKQVKRCARLQRQLLDSALAALKPGGRLVYSTCTFAPEENEAVLAWALARWDGSVRIEPLEALPARSVPALAEWDGQAFPAAVTGARRILPGDGFEGFFLAVLAKSSSASSNV